MSEIHAKTESQSDAFPAAALAERMQVLMIGIGGEVFAIDAGCVREIIDPVPTTRVAGARPYLPCLINVRGNVIPLADIRVRFSMPLTAATPDTRVVVLDIAIDGDPVTVGLIADKVCEVAEVSRAHSQPTPRVGMNWRPEFIQFIATWKDEFVIVPDLERALS